MRIKIQDPIDNEWYYADTFTGNKAIIALKFEANPVGELKHRKADSSNLVKLPHTPLNNRLMGFAGEITESYGLPYQRIACTVEINGVAVFGEGSFFRIIEVTDEYYEIKIFSGIANFFNLIKEKKLKDLSTDKAHSIANPQWTVAGVKASFNSDTPFAIMDWNKEKAPNAIKEGDDENNILSSVDVRTLYPCIKLKKLIDCICADEGYSFESKLNGDNLFLNTAVPCIHGAKAHVPEDEWKASGSYKGLNGETFTLNFQLVSINYRILVAHTPWNTADNIKAVDNRFLEYKFPASGKVTLNISTDVDGPLMINWTKNDEANDYKYTLLKSQCEYTLEGEKDDVFHISFGVKRPFFSTSQILKMSYLNVSLSDFQQNFSVDDYPNTNFPIVQNLPDLSQLDLFKQLVLMFGQMVYVDEITKTVRCYGWDTVYDNIAVANDWSKKLDTRGGKREFIMNDYGQKSLIKYKETEYTDDNDKTIQIKSEGFFTINNQHLDEVKELFEFKSAAVDEARHIGFAMAKIRYRTNGKAEGDAPFCIVHLEEFSSEEDFLELKDNDSSYDTPVKKIIYSNFSPIKSQSLVDTYYSLLSDGILSKCKVLSENILLEPMDILNFDHAIPVYLDKYARHFFVNKINNYKGGITEVELITLL